MDKLLEMLKRIEEAEKLLNKPYSPRLVIDLDGTVYIGWKDLSEKRMNVYASTSIGNISDADLAKKLENWALKAFEKDNIYG